MVRTDVYDTKPYDREQLHKRRERGRRLAFWEFA